MSFVDTSATDGPRLRSWAAAFVLVLALHGLVVAAFLSRPMREDGVEAPPAPIMIELPPMEIAPPSMPSVAMQAAPKPVEIDEKVEPAETTPAETVETLETDTAPPVDPDIAPTDAPPEMPAQITPTEVRPDTPPTAVATQTPAETAEDAPPTVAAEAPAEPVETKAETAVAAETPPEPVETKPDAVVAEIPPEAVVPDTPDPEALVAAEPAPPLPPPKPVEAVAAPPSRPAAEPQKKPEPARPARSAERTPVKPGPAAAKPAAPSAAPATTTAAPASAGGRPDPSEMARYNALIRATLERRKSVPAGSGSLRVTASVRFKIDRGGRVLGVSIAKGSGNPLVDQTALAMVRQGGFPAPPAALPAPTFTFIFDIGFSR